MKKPTELQFNLMSKMAESEYTARNGNAKGLIEDAYPLDSLVWTSMIIENAQDKGTFVSLKNAGYVYHEGTGEDSVVGFTDLGFEIMKEFYGK